MRELQEIGFNPASLIPITNRFNPSSVSGNFESQFHDCLYQSIVLGVTFARYVRSLMNCSNVEFGLDMTAISNLDLEKQVLSN